MAELIVLGLAAGLAAVIGVEQRRGQVDSVRTHSGPLTIFAQQLYRSLPTRTHGCRRVPVHRAEPADCASGTSRTRAATDALAGRTRPPRGASRRSSSWAIVAGLHRAVETARSAQPAEPPGRRRYLRRSLQPHGCDLAAAAKVSTTRSPCPVRRGSGGAALPWFALLWVATLVALIVAQRSLLRRTRRVFNVGLTWPPRRPDHALWLGISWIAVAQPPERRQRPARPRSRLLAQARSRLCRPAPQSAHPGRPGQRRPTTENRFKANMAAPTGGKGLVAKAKTEATDDGVRADAQ